MNYCVVYIEPSGGWSKLGNCKFVSNTKEFKLFCFQQIPFKKLFLEKDFKNILIALKFKKVEIFTKLLN